MFKKIVLDLMTTDEKAITCVSALLGVGGGDLS